MRSVDATVAKGPLLVLATAMLAVVVGAGGAALAAGDSAMAKSTRINGCYNSRTGALRVLTHSARRCGQSELRISWNKQGPAGRAGTAGHVGRQGPSGIVSMDATEFEQSTVVTGSGWTFVVPAFAEKFTNAESTAELSASIDVASSDGNLLFGTLGICDELVGGSTITPVTEISLQFQSPANSFMDQTVSGVVGDLKAGNYDVGLCASNMSANTEQATGEVTIIMAQTRTPVKLPAIPVRPFKVSTAGRNSAKERP